jgi:hypothetical protein
VDHHILNSIAYNVDGLRLSGYFYKDSGRKIAAGPLWDFDRALGSDDGRDSSPQSWNNIGYFSPGTGGVCLFQDKDFVQAWIDRWWQLRSGPLLQCQPAERGHHDGKFRLAMPPVLETQRKWPDNAASGGVYLNEINAMSNYVVTRGELDQRPFPRGGNRQSSPPVSWRLGQE